MACGECLPFLPPPPPPPPLLLLLLLLSAPAAAAAAAVHCCCCSGLELPPGAVLKLRDVVMVVAQQQLQQYIGFMLGVPQVNK
jgi:hypothetical protein